MIRFPYFTRSLVTEYAPAASARLGKDHWHVYEGFRFMLSDRQWLDVQAGTLSDGGTIPSIVQGALAPWGKFGQCYVMHDQGCEYLSLTVDGRPMAITRQRVDELLYVAMEAVGGTRGEIALVRAGVDLHREMRGVSAPSSTAIKRQLEAEWRKR